MPNYRRTNVESYKGPVVEWFDSGMNFHHAIREYSGNKGLKPSLSYSITPLQIKSEIVCNNLVGAVLAGALQ